MFISERWIVFPDRILERVLAKPFAFRYLEWHSKCKLRRVTDDEFVRELLPLSKDPSTQTQGINRSRSQAIKDGYPDHQNRGSQACRLLSKTSFSAFAC